MGKKDRKIKTHSYVEINGRLIEVKDLNEEQRQYVGTAVKISLNRNRLDSLGLAQLPSEKLRPFDEMFKERENDI